MEKRQRSFQVFCAVLILLTTIVGCALFESPQAAFVLGVDAGINGSGLLDEYDKYVDLDPRLANNADAKRIKHETAAKLRKIVKDAQGSAK